MLEQTTHVRFPPGELFIGAFQLQREQQPTHPSITVELGQLKMCLFLFKHPQAVSTHETENAFPKILQHCPAKPTKCVSASLDICDVTSHAPTANVRKKRKTRNRARRTHAESEKLAHKITMQSGILKRLTSAAYQRD